MIDLQKYWWPLATLPELKSDSPLARTLLGVPLVLFRDANGQAAILPDRCPHRHAPLSCGKVRQGEIECPYHGWRFAADGRCTRVPGLAANRGGQLLRPLAVREAHGLLWGCLSLDESTPEPVSPADDGSRLDSFFMIDTVNCSLTAAAENFLDGFHTHFVHAGWIRRDRKRQQVRAQVRSLIDGVEAHYSEEALQSGLISRLFESDRLESMGRFRLPGLAEIEYRGKKGLNLLISAWLTPQGRDSLRIHARVATRSGLLPPWCKKMLLRRLFGVILRQDKAILERTHANRASFGKAGDPWAKAGQLDSELDLLGPSIFRLLAGEDAGECEKNITVQL